MRNALHDEDTAQVRKARGAFFTPEPIARHLVERTVLSADDRVLEPSCGEAAFLTGAVTRLRALRAPAPSHPTAPEAPRSSDVTPRVDGVEIHAASASRAGDLVRAAGGDPHIEVRDFFEVPASPRCTAVVGNPPYIRYQDFTGHARARAQEAALRGGVTLTRLASSWAAFTVHSALMLEPGGRMGLVLPAELLSVNYAAGVRSFLLENFASVELVVFTERVFPEAQEDVVLLIAHGFGTGSATDITITRAQNAAALDGPLDSTRWTPQDPAGKWTPALLSTAAWDSYGTGATAQFTHLETWGDTTLGMVTGNNRYFTLSPAEVRDLGLSGQDVLRISPPGSAHLRGLDLDENRWQDLGEHAGRATFLFRPDDDPSDAARAYIAAGEDAEVDRAYKCRVRRTWWQVPLVDPADLFLTYMNANTPRITTNSAGVRHLNSVHGVYLRPEFRTLGRASLPLGALTSVTLVGAETVGRSYGGGMLKLEPKEADRLPVPRPDLLAAAAEDLRRARPEVAAHLRAGRLLDAVTCVDEIVLRGHAGMSQNELDGLRDAYRELSSRRRARGRRART
ncbi:N-6 DNA methylase [Brevibacterium litoralis]|uniref:N-6 DNA methylase n=1 Tax=Brevibacterium litoralis TaxID=3138935 RepID=UPI0032EEEA87